MDDLISIIVYVCNGANTIETCLRSLVHQTYSNKEIIIINDGSADSSGMICDNFANLYNNIKVVHKKRAGIGNSLNIGLDNAKGKYIAFVDCNDYLHKNTFSLLIEVMDGFNVDAVECIHKKVWQTFGKDGREYTINGLVEIKSQKETLEYRYSAKRFSPSILGKFYRATCLKDIKFQEKLTVSTELQFNLEFLKQADTIAFVNNSLYYRRVEVNRHLAPICKYNPVNDNKDIDVLKFQRDFAKDDDFMHEIAEKAFVSFIFDRLIEIAKDSATWKYKKNSFYIYAKELLAYADNPKIINSKKRRNLINIFKINKFLFRAIYTTYIKSSNNPENIRRYKNEKTVFGL